MHPINVAPQATRMQAAEPVAIGEVEEMLSNFGVGEGEVPDEVIDAFWRQIRGLPDGSDIFIQGGNPKQYHLFVLMRGSLTTGLHLNIEGEITYVPFAELHRDPKVFPLIFIPFDTERAPFSMKASYNCAILPLDKVASNIMIKKVSTEKMLVDINAELAFRVTELFLQRSQPGKSLLALNQALQRLLLRHPEFEAKLIKGTGLLNEFLEFYPKTGSKLEKVFELMVAEIQRYDPRMEPEVFKKAAIHCIKSLTDLNKTSLDHQTDQYFLFKALSMLANERQMMDKQRR